MKYTIKCRDGKMRAKVLVKLLVTEEEWESVKLLAHGEELPVREFLECALNEGLEDAATRSGDG